MPNRTALPAIRSARIANQSGAQERSSRGIAIGVWKGEAVRGLGDRELGIAAIDLVAREARRIAEIFCVGLAIAGIGHRYGQAKECPRARPRRKLVTPGPRASITTNDLMARYDRQLRLGELAIDDVQIGATHAAGSDLYQHLTEGGLRIGNDAVLQRRAGLA